MQHFCTLAPVKYRVGIGVCVYVYVCVYIYIFSLSLSNTRSMLSKKQISCLIRMLFTNVVLTAVVIHHRTGKINLRILSWPVLKRCPGIHQRN